ncbi:ABC transporter substrate-binding protein [Actinoplanes sp. NPDC004185]
MSVLTGRPRLAAALASTVALGLVLSGCSNAGKPAAGGDATLVAYTGQAGDYQINFNPFSPSRIGGLGTIYEPLFFYNKAKVSDPVPLLGTQQSWNADGTVLSVTLREKVTWSDGQPFTAKDVLFTFDLLKKNPAINNTGYDGTAAIVDDTHITFTFKTPAFVKGPDVLSQPIVPEHLWKTISPTKDVVEKPVGTGAYLLKDFKPQAFAYEPNPRYWGGPPKVKTIRFVALSGNQAGADGIAAGTIDWLTSPIPDMKNTHKRFPSYEAYTKWVNQMVLATCSSAAMGCKGPQTDPAVRHAVYSALNRTQLNKLAFQETAGAISPAFALTPSQDQFVSAAVEDKTAAMTAQPDRTAQILEQAGWAKGSDGIYAKDGRRLSLTVEVVTGWTDYIIAIDTMAAQLKTAGIELRAAQSSWNEWTQKKGSGKFQLVIDSLGQGPAPDPYYLYTYFFDSGSGAKVGQDAGNNFSRYANPQVDAALDKLATFPLDNQAARQPYFATVQQAIVRDMPYIPVMTGGTTSVWNTAKFTGWPSDADLYAVPAVWSAFDAAEVFKRLTPKS